MTWQDDLDAAYDLYYDNITDVAFEYGRIGLTRKSNLYYDFAGYLLDWM